LSGRRREGSDKNLQLNVYISSASDGYFLLRAVEIPELTARASTIEDIPAQVRTAAAALTGKAPDDFEVSLDY
jgi:predicted RNase H-like HicB family nuclease